MVNNFTIFFPVFFYCSRGYPPGCSHLHHCLYAFINRYTGSIIDLADKAIVYVADAMDWRVEFDGSLERKEIPEIPVDAVREAVINAFAHRIIESGQSVDVSAYKSFIEIYSPGRFPEGVKPEQFITEIRKPIRRNPLVTRTLYYSRDMESFATGLKRIYGRSFGGWPDEKRFDSSGLLFVKKGMKVYE